MNIQTPKIKSNSRVIILAVVLIIIGLAIMIPRGLGMLNFFKEANYATRNNFQNGNPSPDLIRPWMTIRYISAAYGVPQAYLFDGAGIPPNKENSMQSLKRLNDKLKLSEQDQQPTLMFKIRDIVREYQANPVVTGLIERSVQEWMTIQYISNSTGIPMDEIFRAINLPAEGNAYLPLGFLSDKNDYPGGHKGLIMALQKLVDSQPVQP